MPSVIGFCVSSTMGVGFTSVVSGDGISSTLTTSSGYCSPSYNFTHALVLTLGCLEVWLASSCFGGAMVVSIKFLLSLNFLYALCELCLLSLFVYSFFANRLFVPASVHCKGIA
jgi:hypothetical protein